MPRRGARAPALPMWRSGCDLRFWDRIHSHYVTAKSVSLAVSSFRASSSPFAICGRLGEGDAKSVHICSAHGPGYVALGHSLEVEDRATATVGARPIYR